MHIAQCVSIANECDQKALENWLRDTCMPHIVDHDSMPLEDLAGSYYGINMSGEILYFRQEKYFTVQCS
jgi:hypothetical protein